MDPNTISIDRNGTFAAGGPAALLDALARNGYPARIVPAGRAAELRSELEGRRSRGELDGAVDADYLAELVFDPPEEFTARSIVVAAVPRPETAGVFHTDEGARKLTIPPTYTGYRAVTRSWVQWLGDFLGDHGYHAARAILPLKLLATRSGLATYGRNNITYVEGLGSYFELVAAWTDVPCDAGEWGPDRMLDRCLRCRACVKRCPTSAIRVDPFRLDTARCLPLHNERPGSVPFPDWIDADAHHTLIGCMECQWICPENRRVNGWVEDTEHFTAEETAMLLRGAREEDLPEETAVKLQRLDATRFLDLLPRNLGAALRSQNRAFTSRAKRFGAPENGTASSEPKKEGQ